MATLAPLTDSNACVTPEYFDVLLERGELAHVHVELIDGTMVFQLPQGRLHLFALSLLIEALVSEARDVGLMMTTQGTIPMDGNRPEPDLALLDYDVRRPTGQFDGTRVRLAVEIAVSSLAFDRQRKTILYATQGIPEYWIVNPVARQIEVYREPGMDGYRILRIAGEDESIDALCLPDHSILVADLMPTPDSEDV